MLQSHEARHDHPPAARAMKSKLSRLNTITDSSTEFYARHDSLPYLIDRSLLGILGIDGDDDDNDSSSSSVSFVLTTEVVTSAVQTEAAVTTTVGGKNTVSTVTSSFLTTVKSIESIAATAASSSSSSSSKTTASSSSTTSSSSSATTATSTSAAKSSETLAVATSTQSSISASLITSGTSSAATSSVTSGNDQDSTTTTSANKKFGLSTAAIAIIAVSSALVLASVIFLIIRRRMKNNRKKRYSNWNVPGSFPSNGNDGGNAGVKAVEEGMVQRDLGRSGTMGGTGAASIQSYTFTAPRNANGGMNPNISAARYNAPNPNQQPPFRLNNIPSPPKPSYNNPVTPSVAAGTGVTTSASASHYYSSVRAAPTSPTAKSTITTFTYSSATTTTASGGAGGGMAVVRVTYIPSMPDELAIMPGENLRIASAYDDGWALCVNSRGEQGMVPLECLEGGAGQFSGYAGGDGRSDKRASSLAGAGARRSAISGR